MTCVAGNRNILKVISKDLEEKGLAVRLGNPFGKGGIGSSVGQPIHQFSIFGNIFNAAITC